MFGNQDVQEELQNRLLEVTTRINSIINHPNRIKRAFNKTTFGFIGIAFLCTVLFIVLPIIILVGLISYLLRLQPNETDSRPLAVLKKAINTIFSVVIRLPILLFVILISPLLLCFALVNYSELRELRNILHGFGQLTAHALVGSQNTHDTQVNEHIKSAVEKLVGRYGEPSKNFNEGLLKYIKEIKDFPVDVTSEEVAEKITQNQTIKAKLQQSELTEFTKVLIEAIEETKNSSNSALKVYGVNFSSKKIIDEIKEEKRGLVVKCLERIRQNNDTRHGLTLRQAINLVMTALEDESSIIGRSKKELKEGKDALIRRLLEIQTEYIGNREACFVGSFNKIIETLDHIHTLVATPLGIERAKQAAMYKAPVIVNELFKQQSESIKKL